MIQDGTPPRGIARQTTNPHTNVRTQQVGRRLFLNTCSVKQPEPAPRAAATEHSILGGLLLVSHVTMWRQNGASALLPLPFERRTSLQRNRVRGSARHRVSEIEDILPRASAWRPCSSCALVTEFDHDPVRPAPGICLDYQVAALHEGGTAGTSWCADRCLTDGQRSARQLTLASDRKSRRCALLPRRQPLEVV